MIKKFANKTKKFINNIKYPWVQKILWTFVKIGNVSISLCQDFCATFKDVKLYKKDSLSDEDKQWLIRLGKKEKDNPYESFESYRDPECIDKKTMRGDDLFLCSLLPNGCSILELGCGNGRLGVILTKLKNIDYTGVDISAVAVEEAKKKGLKAYVCDLDNFNDATLEMFGKRRYDYVISIWTLQLLRKQEELIPKLFEFTDTQLHGIWNAGHWSSRLRFLFGRFPIYSYTSGPLGNLLYPFAYGAYNRHWTFKDFKAYARELGLVATIAGVGYKFTMRTANLKRNMIYPSLRCGRVLWKITTK